MTIPNEVWAAFVALAAAATYFLRRKAAKTPAPTEQLLSLLVEMAKKHDEKQDRILDILRGLSPCAWQGGSAPEAWRREVQAVLDRERLRDLEDDRHRKGR